jgi:hypothetical protein
LVARSSRAMTAREFETSISEDCAMNDSTKYLIANTPRDYAIGYGKPPAHKGFRKSVSGNPQGRPAARRLFARRRWP